MQSRGQTTNWSAYWGPEAQGWTEHWLQIRQASIYVILVQLSHICGFWRLLFRILGLVFFSIHIYMVEIGEIACVYDGHVGENLTCPFFILQRPTANKTSGAPSYSRWSSSQPHQVICPCQKGYEAQVDTCFLLKWIHEGNPECYWPALAQLGHAGLWGCCRISCGKLLDAVAGHGKACTAVPRLMQWCLSDLSGVDIVAESPYPLHLVT